MTYVGGFPFATSQAEQAEYDRLYKDIYNELSKAAVAGVAAMTTAATAAVSNITKSATTNITYTTAAATSGQVANAVNKLLDSM